MRLEKSELWAIMTTLLLVAAVYAGSLLPKKSCGQRGNSLTVSIRLPKDARCLLPGYNYHLLKGLSARIGMEPEIQFDKYSGASADSLPAADILVLPLQDSLQNSSRFTVIPVDSACIWVIGRRQVSLTDKALNFLDEYVGSRDYAATHYIYMHTYDPFRAGRRSRLSPYDGIIKKYADSLSFDWRFLSAVAYQESNFHIEARSGRGALGLMQLLPSTGKHYGAEDLHDPEQNIRAGVSYLRSLRRQFAKASEDDTERTKMMLAAYNAGMTRVQNSITDQGTLDIDPEWGKETIDYVDRVLAIYNEFCRICPEK